METTGRVSKRKRLGKRPPSQDDRTFQLSHYLPEKQGFSGTLNRLTSTLQNGVLENDFSRRSKKYYPLHTAR